MNRVGATQSSDALADCWVNRTTQTNRGNDGVTFYTATIFIYYILFKIFISCIITCINIQCRITCIWPWNYTHFQFNIYYNSILCLYIFIPRGSVYTMGGIDLFSPPDPFHWYFRSAQGSG